MWMGKHIPLCATEREIVRSDPACIVVQKTEKANSSAEGQKPYNRGTGDNVPIRYDGRVFKYDKDFETFLTCAEDSDEAFAAQRDLFTKSGNWS